MLKMKYKSNKKGIKLKKADDPQVVLETKFLFGGIT